MKTLIVFAHPDKRSFCSAILNQFQKGLQNAGHDHQTINLYKIGFNPVFDTQDMAYFTDETVPETVLENMRLKEKVIEMAGGPIRRLLAKKWMKKKDLKSVARMVNGRKPKDVLEQQKKVLWADALVFISPIYWLGFPAIMKGWFERVFTYGFAYQLTLEGWKGNMKGRIPKLNHEKALIINTTFFSERDYRPVLTGAIEQIVDVWGLKYPGVKHVEHKYFWSVSAVGESGRKIYLDEAYELGAQF